MFIDKLGHQHKKNWEYSINFSLESVGRTALPAWVSRYIGVDRACLQQCCDGYVCANAPSLHGDNYKKRQTGGRFGIFSLVKLLLL